MCGIAGLYDPLGVGAAGERLVGRMCASLVHRGPDSDGFCSPSPCVALGVRRLAIVDLVTGDQPLFNEDRSVALVFNGEIYNHRELRTELAARSHEFRSGNDGEVIVHLYEERGLDMFPALRGMFALALWDGSLSRLLLAVDHVGIKPLYVVRRGGRLLFASEVGALLADASVPRRLDLAAVDTYLAFGSLIGPGTLLAGVERLAPGCALVAEAGGVRPLRHFTLAYPEAAARPNAPEAIAAETRDRFRDAVRLHLRSDVPVGLFLSGGIDSTAILAAMRAELGGGIQTFTVGYRSADGHVPPADETAAARRVAVHFGTEHHELRLAARDWWTMLGEYARSGSEPVANPAMVTLQALAEVAAAKVKVVLNGTGGDELFAGYRSHVVQPRLLRLAALLAGAAPQALRRWAGGPLWRRLEPVLPALRRRRWLGALPPYLCELRALLLPPDEALRRLSSHDGWTFSDTLREELYGGDLRAAWRQVRHAESAFAELLRAIVARDPGDLVHGLTLATWLPGNGLLTLDAVTMAHGLEARLPYFDRPLLEHAAAIPHRIRARGNKGVLRMAVHQDLPPFARTRRKRPFETPLGSWLGRELASEVKQVLLDRRTRDRGLLRHDAVERLLARHFGGAADHTEVVFRLLVLELWLRHRLEAPPAGAGGAAP